MDTETIAVIAGGVVLFGLVSRRLETSLLSGPMIFAAFGLLIGPTVLGLADLDFEKGFINGLAEVTLILVLFSDAARIDLRVVRRNHNLPVRMLLIGMPLIIVAGTLAGLALPFGLTLWEAALLAAILAPTDAALGQSVVSSPLVPMRVRQALNIESGLNDGIALPLVLLFASLASVSPSEDRNWLLFGLMQITLGPLAGVGVGWVSARLIDRAVKIGWMAELFGGPAILGVALLGFTGAEIIGGNGFIAAFVSGLVFGNTVRDRCRFLFDFGEAESQLLALLTFLIFGATLLPEAFGNTSLIVILYAGLSLTLVRMVPIAISLTGAGLRPPTIGFLAWFGPRGLASILFALFVLEETEIPGGDTIMLLVIVTVTISIIAHGMSAAPASRWYGALIQNIPDCKEKQPVTELPVRVGKVSRETPE